MELDHSPECLYALATTKKPIVRYKWPEFYVNKVIFCSVLFCSEISLDCTLGGHSSLKDILNLKAGSQQLW